MENERRAKITTVELDKGEGKKTLYVVIERVLNNGKEEKVSINVNQTYFNKIKKFLEKN